MHAKSGFYFCKPGICSAAHIFPIPCIPCNSRHRRHLGRSFCRRLRCNQNRNNSHCHSADNSCRTHSKQWNTDKFLSCHKPQQGAHSPCDQNTKDDTCRNRNLTPVQGFQPYEPDNLLPAHTDTAHHTEKFCPLGNIAVHTACNHQRSCNQYQNKQHNSNHVNLLHSRIPAKGSRPHQSFIYFDIFIRPSILFLDV